MQHKPELIFVSVVFIPAGGRRGECYISSLVTVWLWCVDHKTCHINNNMYMHYGVVRDGEQWTVFCYTHLVQPLYITWILFICMYFVHNRKKYLWTGFVLNVQGWCGELWGTFVILPVSDFTTHIISLSSAGTKKIFLKSFEGLQKLFFVTLSAKCLTSPEIKSIAAS